MLHLYWLSKRLRAAAAAADYVGDALDNLGDELAYARRVMRTDGWEVSPAAAPRAPKPEKPARAYPPAHAEGTEQIELAHVTYTIGRAAKGWWSVASTRGDDRPFLNADSWTALLSQLSQRHKLEAERLSMVARDVPAAHRCMVASPDGEPSHRCECERGHEGNHRHADATWATYSDAESDGDA